MPAVMEFPARVIERVHKEVVVDPLTGCHLSTLSIHTEGYSQIGWADDEGARRSSYGHRVAWIAANGRAFNAARLQRRGSVARLHPL